MVNIRLLTVGVMMVGNNTKVTGNEVTGSLWNEIFTNIGAVYTGDTFMNDQQHDSTPGLVWWVSYYLFCSWYSIVMGNLFVIVLTEIEKDNGDI